MKCDWGVPCFCGSGVVNAVSGASVRYRFSLSSSRWGGGRGCMMLRELNVCFLQIVNAEPAPLVLPPLTYVHSSTFLHDGLIYFSLIYFVSLFLYIGPLLLYKSYCAILFFLCLDTNVLSCISGVGCVAEGGFGCSMIWIFGVSQINKVPSDELSMRKVRGEIICNQVNLTKTRPGCVSHQSPLEQIFALIWRFSWHISSSKFSLLWCETLLLFWLWAQIYWSLIPPQNYKKGIHFILFLLHLLF